MSVLMEFAMFPTDKGGSVSKYVSKVIEMIRADCKDYKLTPMGTIIETENIDDALKIVKKQAKFLKWIRKGFIHQLNWISERTAAIV
jgi:uncharacterized protein YqgV (UPF0045/DUF77 family)